MTNFEINDFSSRTEEEERKDYGTRFGMILIAIFVIVIGSLGIVSICSCAANAQNITDTGTKPVFNPYSITDCIDSNNQFYYRITDTVTIHVTCADEETAVLLVAAVDEFNARAFADGAEDTFAGSIEEEAWLDWFAEVFKIEHMYVYGLEIWALQLSDTYVM